MKTLILHHSADMDGILSGVIAKYYCRHTANPGDHIITAGADYGDNLDKTYQGWSLDQFDKIYVIDFSDDWLFNNEAIRNKIIWIDHHINAIEKNYNVAKYVLDGVAACRLTQQFFANVNYAFLTEYDYIERKVNEPLLVALIGEHDIWDETSVFARKLNFGITNIKFEAIEFLHEETRHVIAGKKNDEKNLHQSERLVRICDVGEGVINYIQRTSSILGGGIPINIFGHKGIAFNTHIRSSLIHRLKDDEEFMMVWNDTGKPLMKLSFYSEEKVEALKFAKYFGGGGHKRACGCQVDFNTLTLILKNHYANIKP